MVKREKTNRNWNCLRRSRQNVIVSIDVCPEVQISEQYSSPMTLKESLHLPLSQHWQTYDYLEKHSNLQPSV